MSDSCGDASASAIVECHHAAVGQRQLQLALCLLEGHLARDGAVHLVREPVLAGHGLQLQHAVNVFVHVGRIVAHVLVFPFHRFVHHHRFG